MEKYKCKLCFKIFMNGKALGGHMSRSHFTNLPLPKTLQKKEVAERTESTSEFDSDGHGSEEKGLIYGLRENPKKSFRLTDGEFRDAGSFVLGDKESESESTRNPTRKRSKRARRMALDNNVGCKKGSNESLTELEMVSSVSDVAATPDEDVAFCLLMLSRDVWSSHDSVELKPAPSQTRCQHRCEMCKKVFKSSQALGGHRISHKKMVKKSRNGGNMEQKTRHFGKKLHECPFCGKVFGSGQALGGHKRTHLLGTSTTAAASCSSKVGDSLVEDSNSNEKSQERFIIDLNVPAPMDDDDEDQQEFSGVSNAADFVTIIPLKIEH